MTIVVDKGANKKGEEMTTREAVKYCNFNNEQTFRKYRDRIGIKGYEKWGKGHRLFYKREDIERLKQYMDSPHIP